jgi:hypothetical protein
MIAPSKKPMACRQLVAGNLNLANNVAATVYPSLLVGFIPSHEIKFLTILAQLPVVFQKRRARFPGEQYPTSGRNPPL